MLRLSSCSPRRKFYVAFLAASPGSFFSAATLSLLLTIADFVKDPIDMTITKKSRKCFVFFNTTSQKLDEKPFGPNENK